MGGIWGRNIKFSLFGESHGEGIGIVIDGLPPGIELDIKNINFEMGRRRPGKNELATSRNEEDSFKIISGYFNGCTTGTPLCIVIYNQNKRSRDYDNIKSTMRPGHADLTGYYKYDGFNDYRGGGHFSGRLTAPIVFAGAVAKQILRKKGINIGSHIYQIGHIKDKSFDKVHIKKGLLDDLRNKEFPTIDEEKSIRMKDLILKVKEDKDSIGGIIEGAITNIPIGLGSPFFDSIESNLAHLLFSIPAVKGLEFGEGFDISRLKGSEANDEFYIEGDKIKTYTNNNGGVLGGISNGMPIVFRVAFKPTPSIGKSQRTIDISERKNTDIAIEGRHDPCIVPRAIPVVEAVAAMAILDEYLKE